LKDLNDYRNKIDEIDEKIVKLFEERMKVVVGIAEYKIQNEIPILNEGRENEVIKKNQDRLENKELNNSLEEFYKSFMKISRNYQSEKINSWKKENQVKNTLPSTESNDMLQNKTSVVYQGVPGSYSYNALKNFFSLRYNLEDINKINVENFEDVFVALKSEKVKYGILPLENSSTGGISDVYDLIRNHNFFIIGERKIKVEHNLLGIKGSKIEDIEEVYSHPQGIQQCKKYFDNYPHLKLRPYTNTAASAKYIKESNDIKKAAIASMDAKEIYDLDILSSNINYNENNYTRFVVISKDMELSNKADKVSVVLSVQHESGALYNVLKVFWKHKLNMLKIESRPIQDTPWEYFFYIDFHGNIKDNLVKNAVEEMRNESSYFKVLGNYEAHI
jgi:chorismate mutase/prephenate dehydratase